MRHSVRLPNCQGMEPPLLSRKVTLHSSVRSTGLTAKRKDEFGLRAKHISLTEPGVYAWLASPPL